MWHIEELKQPHCFEFLVRTFCFTIPCGSGSCFCKQRKHQLGKVTCGQKRHTSWPATNYGYKDVIIIRTHQPQQNNPQQQPRRSKETSKLLATTNSRPNATLHSGCFCNMVPPNSHSMTRVQPLPAAPGDALHSTTSQPGASPQNALRRPWISGADAPSCGQKKHTRWPATNAKCWCAIEFRLLVQHGAAQQSFDD